MILNSVQLVGRLTRDVELRFTSSGVAVGNFTIAIDRPFTNQQGERETDFINCVIWRKSAENFANFTRKGSLVGVEGRIQTRNYDNQQGQRVYVTEVLVDQFHLLEPKSVTDQRRQQDSASNSAGYGNDGGYNSYQANQNNSYSNSYNNSYQANQTQASQADNQSNYSAPSTDNPNNSFNPSTAGSPYLADGQKIDISEDDLPF